MNELIKITEKDGKQTVSARELHEKLEVKSQFRDWFKRMVSYGFEENNDYVTVAQKKATAQGNESLYKEHFVSIDMAKEICMIQRSEQGRKFRKYFIECEKALKEVVKKLPEEKPYVARVESAKLLHEIGNEYSGLSKTYKQVLDAHATKELTGEFLLPLPVVVRKTYSATEVGNLLGISANRVGKIANANNLKTDEYGEWYRDKAVGSSREVDVFRYYDVAIPVIKKYAC